MSKHFKALQTDHRVLMYHSIGGSVISDPANVYGVSKERFSWQMQYLKEGFRGQVVDFSDGILSHADNSMSITFDDGYKDNLYVASPILEELNFSYTVFVSTDFIKSQKSGFLSKSELIELSCMPGASIGSHGVSHIALTQCSDRQLRGELIDSKHYIEDIIGKEVSSIGYPYGLVDQRVVDATREAGYKLGGTSYNDKNDENSELLFLSRTCIFDSDNLQVFKQKANGYWDWLKYIQNKPDISSYVKT